jgi:Zn-dependent protease/predicted transcriptional regulator
LGLNDLKSQITLGKVFGIKIGLHYSWFLIALLIVFSLSGEFRAGHPQWASGLVLTLAIVTAVLFFVSLLLHELSHSLVARARGIPVREITLFALGGVSQIEGEAGSAKTEFWMAVVGPLTSAFIGLTCVGVVAIAGGETRSPFTAVLAWLGYINLGLAAFNMVPGYPLDGGRILRAIVWWKTGDMDRATRSAAKVGQAVGGALIAMGVIQYFGGAGLGGLWIAFIGWFLLQAAGVSYIEAGLKRSLQNVRVSDVMARDCPTVDARLSVQDFVDHQLLRTGRRCFIVAGNGGIAGLVTSHEIRQTDRAQWPHMTLEDVMRPLKSMRTVTPDTPLASALEVMARDDFNQLPVISNGHLEGVLSRAEVLNYLQTRAELQA